MNKVKYSYENLCKDVQELIRQMNIENYYPDIVAGFSRGGLMPAVMLSHYWNIPMIPIQYSLRDFNYNNHIENFRTKVLPTSKILVVDDIVDNGHTFKSFMSDLSDYDIKTASLYYNIGQDIFVPDFYVNEINKMEKPSWIVFPLEEWWKN